MKTLPILAAAAIWFAVNAGSASAQYSHVPDGHGVQFTAADDGTQGEDASIWSQPGRVYLINLGDPSQVNPLSHPPQRFGGDPPTWMPSRQGQPGRAGGDPSTEGPLTHPPQ